MGANHHSFQDTRSGPCPRCCCPREFFLPCTATLTLGRGNDQSPSEVPVTRWNAGPARLTVRGRTGFRGRKQPFGAEPGGGVRNREQGASCLSAASSCPAGSAARRPGSSQRQGCPFFWFFSLGRQRKERLPARGRGHSGDAGASWSTFPRWRVGTIKRIKRLRQGRCNIIAGMARSYYTSGRPAGKGCERAMPAIRVGTITRSDVEQRMEGWTTVWWPDRQRAPPG